MAVYLLKHWRLILALVTILGAFTYGFIIGRESVINKQLRDDLNGAKNANEIRQTISRLPDGDAAKRLRKHWQ